MDSQEVTDWVTRARMDLRDAEALFGAGGLPENVCYHAHQAAEKALKAALLRVGFNVPRTHDLAILAETLARDELSLLVEELASLSRWIRFARYPSDTRQEDPVLDAQLAIQYAARILEVTLD